MADLAEQNATPLWKSRINDASDRFKALPNNKKILFLVAIAAILSVVIGMAVLNRQPTKSFSPIFLIVTVGKSPRHCSR
ncbi:hypothetical protein [Paludibacterium denitrificans]|uniref:hypothetical protein n=1 Tax=Paludibacterium denitrificans TaxID=2675226 RepID=UPI001E2DA364|nr:hypothetical protein [Paludibacterium denitrificans]